MNPNDSLAQQQAIFNQVVQNQQQWFWVMIAFQIVALIVGGWVIYMFYARLRDIAEELMNLRVAYQFSKARKPDAAHPPTPPGPVANPLKSDTARYQPK